jgi:hypothetical protein
MAHSQVSDGYSVLQVLKIRAITREEPIAALPEADRRSPRQVLRAVAAAVAGHGWRRPRRAGC